MADSVALRNLILNAYCNEAGITITPYLSLHTNDPWLSGVNEVSGGSYARQAATFSAASGGVAELSEELVFDDMPGVRVTHVGLWSAESGGTYLRGSPLTEWVTVPEGDAVRFQPGDLSIECTSELSESVLMLTEVAGALSGGANLENGYATLRVSLHTGDPGDDGSDEVTGGDYARQTPPFGAAADGECANDTAVVFAGLPACTVTHVGIWTPGGAFLRGGALSEAKGVPAEGTLRFAVGQLVLFQSEGEANTGW